MTDHINPHACMAVLLKVKHLPGIGYKSNKGLGNKTPNIDQ